MHFQGTHRPWVRLMMALLGTALFAFGVNRFVVPAGLYSSGLLGYCQLLRTLLLPYMHWLPEGMDFAGIIYYILNIPLFFLAYRSLGKRFFWTTLACTTWATLLMSLLPTTPVLEDTLASCLLGGICVGTGGGLVMTNGGCTGGLDILSLWISKRNNGLTVGRFNIVLNGILYTICLLLFNVGTVIYSVIYMVINAMMVDRAHQQNINVQVLIFTKSKDPQLPQQIMTGLHRGLTYWDGTGAYTGQDVRILCICISKYEVEDLRQIVQKLDPAALLVTEEGVGIHGNFRHRIGT